MYQLFHHSNITHSSCGGHWGLYEPVMLHHRLGEMEMVHATPLLGAHLRWPVDVSYPMLIQGCSIIDGAASWGYILGHSESFCVPQPAD